MFPHQAPKEGEEADPGLDSQLSGRGQGHLLGHCLGCVQVHYQQVHRPCVWGVGQQAGTQLNRDSLYRRQRVNSQRPPTDVDRIKQTTEMDECLLWATHCAKHSMWMLSFKPLRKLMCQQGSSLLPHFSIGETEVERELAPSSQAPGFLSSPEAASQLQENIPLCAGLEKWRVWGREGWIPGPRNPQKSWR